MAKIDEAVKILRAEENKGKSRKDFIFLIMTNLNMTDAGASTYYYNATKRIATEDAIKGLETKDSTTESTTSAKPVAETMAETVEPKIEVTNDVVEIVPTKPAKARKEKELAAASQRSPKFSMDTGSAEIDQFLANLDTSCVPKFLRK